MANIFPITVQEAANASFPGLLKTIEGTKDVIDTRTRIFSWIQQHSISPMDAYTLDSFPEAYHAVSVWGRSKVCYHVHPALFEDFVQGEQANGSENLPASLLLDMPYECIYLECPEMHVKMNSLKNSSVVIDELYTTGEIFVFRNTPNKRYEMDGIVVVAKTKMNPRSPWYSQYLPIMPGKTLKEAFLEYGWLPKWYQELHGTTRNKNEWAGSTFLARIVAQVLLYIHAANESGDVVERKKPPKPRKQQQKTELKIKAVRDVDVGYIIGRDIYVSRQQAQRSQPQLPHTESGAGTGTPKSPHVRRAHWHSFWKKDEEKEGEKKLIIKWVSAVAVNGGRDVPTVHTVRKPKRSERK